MKYKIRRFIKRIHNVDVKYYVKETPKSKFERLCCLTKWYFPDGENFCVDIPSEGIHAFYGRLGFIKAINEVISYLEKLRTEFEP